MFAVLLTISATFTLTEFTFLVVQNKLTAFWFKDKELALAFGITLAFSRLGSVLNFFLTETFTDAFGLKWTLWGGMWFYLLISNACTNFSSRCGDVEIW